MNNLDNHRTTIASESDEPRSEFATIMGIEDNERTKDWPKHDPNPNHCTGHGHIQCMKDGQHSWFNHSQDTYHDPKYAHLSNLPEGFVEP